SRRKVELAGAGLAHQPWNERVDLLRRNWPGAKDEWVAFLALVLLGIDVELLPLDDGRPFDGLPHRAVDAAEHDVDPILLDELAGLRRADAVDGFAVLEVQFESTAQQAAVRVDVVDHHGG